MELKFKIEEINYGDAAVLAKNLLGKHFVDRTDALGMAASAVSGLSGKLIRVMMAEITDEKVNGLIVAFADEYKQKIIDMGNELSAKHDLGVQVEDFEVTSELEVWVKTGQIDYPCAVGRFLPVVKEKLLNMGGPVALVRPMIQNASASQICGLMDKVLGSKKEAFIVNLINQNSEKLVAAVEKKAAQKKVRLKIGQFQVAE